MASKRAHQSAAKITQRILLGASCPSIYLNRREAQCIKHLMDGKKIKKIANILRLSPRTVEYYLVKLRVRLGCLSRAELITLIKNSDFNKQYAAANAELDEGNYKAIELLEFFGNSNPLQEQINLMENLLLAAKDFEF